MSKQLVPAFADAIRVYYTSEELRELYGLFASELQWDNARNQPAHLSIATRLITETDHGNNRRILEALLPSLFARCSEMVAKTSWENRDSHLEMQACLEKLRPLLENSTVPSDITVADNRRFTAKSEIRDLLAKADEGVLLVDAYIGVGTLDCFRELSHPIRILTAHHSLAIEKGFDAAVKDFRSEDRVVDVRRHTKLHDRYLIFNNRCWLIGSSIKDAGKKALNVIECIDSKQAIMSDAEKKWTEGIVHL